MVTKDLTAPELGRLLDERAPVQIVDVRSADEYGSGHVPGALNLPMEVLDARRGDLDSGRRVVLVCQGGTRAGMACELLEEGPYDVWRLAGGTDAWVREGMPVVRSRRSAWAIERQVRLVVGVLLLIGAGLTLSVSRLWAFLPLALGMGLTFAGLSNTCGMGMLFARMPWNGVKR